MIVVQALKEYKVLEKIATISLSNLRSARSIGSVIVIGCLEKKGLQKIQW